jgi:hypothetical protein
MPESEDRVRERQAADYRPPILVEPLPGRPIPQWRPVEGEASGPADPQAPTT